MKKQETKNENAEAIVPQGSTGMTFFAAANPTEVLETLQQLKEIGFTANNLYRVKVPAAGGQFWTLPDENGEEQPTRTFNGVIVYAQWKLRAWWAQPMGQGEGNQPPACTSLDGEHGYGVIDPERVGIEEPSVHNCKDCKWGQFKSKRVANGAVSRARDCKEMIRLAIYREHDRVPLILTVPPGSLKAVREYAANQVARTNRPPYSYVTNFALVQEKNADGISYSRIVCKQEKMLSPEESQRFKELGALFASTAVSSAQIDRNAVDGAS